MSVCARPRRRTATHLVGALVAVAATTATSAAAPAATVPHESLAPDRQDLQLALAVEDQDFAVPPGSTWSIRLRLDGPVDGIEPVDAPGDDVVVVVVAHQRVEDQAELVAALDGALSDVVDRVDVPISDVATATSDGAELDLTVPTSAERGDDALTLGSAGLYPVSLLVQRNGFTLANQLTFLERLPNTPSDGPGLGIAVLAAVDELGPEPTADQLDAGRRQLESLVRLGRATDGPITVALPPAQVSAADEALVDDLGDALASAELLALPANQLDPSAAVAIGGADEFSRELREGEDTLARLLPDTPTRRAAWLTSDPVSTAAASMLRDPLGFRLLVLDQGVYSTLDGNIGGFTDSSLTVETDLGDGGTLPTALVSPLGTELDTDRREAAGSTPTEAAVRVVAELLTISRELGPDQRRNVVLATPAVALPDPATVAAITRFATDHPDLDMTTLSRLVGTTDTMLVDGEPVTLRLPERAGPDLGARAERIDLTRVYAASAASMLPDIERSMVWQADLDTLLSTGLSDERVDTTLDRLSEEIDAVYASVTAPEPFTFTLTGRSSTLRVNVRNSTDEQRTVVVRATSPKLRFPDGDLEVTLEPGLNEIELPVEALANGTSSVELVILTPAFQQRIGNPTFLTAKVNALTGLGQVITGGAVVVLASWWFSHLRRNRRRRRAATALVEADPDAPAISPDAAEATAGEHHD